MPPQLEKQVADALEGCSDCQQELARISQVRSVFSEALPSVEPPALLHANIMREARLKAYAVAENKQASAFDKLQAMLFHPGFATAAAVVLVAFGIFYILGDEALRPDKAMVGEKTSPRRDAKAKEAPPAPAAIAADQGAKSDNAPGAQDLEEDVEEKASAEEGDEPSLAETNNSKKSAKPAGLAARKARFADPAPNQKADPAAEDSKALADEAQNARKEALTEREADERAKNDFKYKQAPSEAGSVANDFDTSNRDIAEKGEAEGEIKEELAAKRDAPADRPPTVRKGMSRAQRGADNGIDSLNKKSNNVFNSNSLGQGNSSAGSIRGDGGGGSVYNQSGSAGDDNLNSQAEVFTDPAERYNQGMRRFNRSEWGGAISEFDAFMNSAPSTSNYYALALYHKARSLYNQGNYAAAITEYRKVISQHPGFERKAEARYYLAQCLLRVDPNNQEALQLLESLSKGSGGLAERARKDYDKAYGKREQRSKKPVQRKDNAKPKKAPARNYDFDEASDKPTILE